MEITCIEDLQRLVSEGEAEFHHYGNVRSFEHEGMIAFDYTPKAEQDGIWNAFERMSRGLVLCRKTGRILARPYEKFFNVGQHGANPVGPITLAMNKEDGSMGIIFMDLDGNIRCNTRGSFKSDQAIWCMDLIKTFSDEQKSYFHSGETVICEIVYPENRIVVDYEGFEGIIIHAIVDNVIGRASKNYVDYIVARINSPKVKVVETYDLKTVEECLEFIESRPGTKAEGLVIMDSEGSLFKLKSQEYLALHRIVTNVTPKRVWELMCLGEFESYRETFPDEFLTEIDQYYQEISHWAIRHSIVAGTAYDDAPKTDTQKEYAEWVKMQDPIIQPWLFSKHAGKDVDNYFLKQWKKLTKYEGE